MRPLRASDGAVFAARLADPEGTAFSDWGPLGAGAAQAWLRDLMAAAVGPWGTRALVRREDGLVPGYAGLSAAPDRVAPGDVEVGIRLGRAAWGQSYGVEAARALGAAARAAPDVVRAVAVVDPGHGRSQRMLARLGVGFVREVRFPGYDHPDPLYAVAR